ncbi:MULTISPECIES: hypothetical protein [Stenotrophomonas]|jgi:hypothetical protein|uniref:Uncharacterized protein n=1 Tax=Stenotrophomonas maltophilia TaxID=40324 RepID=A0A4V3RIY0_STEMA|nr:MULTISPECIES: hypothetical protein [Stenotrophomonas]MBD3827808.1 hypothetical protein [Stenotrophomonas sp.]QIO89553.1 hypothetical protein G9274_003238 [Stenotrophomonas rhizophila]TGY33870.1 hypothetical protein E5352_10855 [Stenotrophomonas maltophilia]
MSSASLSIPAVIDVDAEVGHWRQRHADGTLGSGSFGHYVPWIKFACDSLITQPRASDEQRDESFQTHYALQIMPRLSEDQARDFVEQCWEHVYRAGRQDLASRPRLGARA